MSDAIDAAVEEHGERREHHEMMQQLYLAWYETEFGGQFSSSTSPYLHVAAQIAGWFTKDGFPAKIVKVTVVDGQPVAEWVQR